MDIKGKENGQNKKYRQYLFLKTHKLIAVAAICAMVFSLWCGLGVNSTRAIIPGDTVFQFGESQLTSNSAEQMYPDIYQYGYNNWALVWQDNRNGNWDIYMYSQKYLGNSIWETQWDTQITANSGNNIKPKIYNDKIVYQSDRNGNWDIFMYDLTSKVETQITTDTANQESVAIYGDIIVWQDWRSVWRHSPYLETYPGMSIYIYNLNSQTEEQLQLPQDACFSPAISGNSVAYLGENYWRDTTSGITLLQANICFYDLSTGQKYTVAAGDFGGVPLSYQNRAMSSPAVGGSLVAYTESGARIVVRNVIDSTSWATAWGTQNYADISGNYVVYQGYSENRWDIYVYDFTRNLFSDATAHPADQINPAISTGYANFIVYSDYRNGNWDIYLTAFWYGAGADFIPSRPITPSGVIDYLEDSKSRILEVPTDGFAGANYKVKENRRNTLLNQLDSAIASIDFAVNSNNLKLRVKYLQSAIEQLDDLTYKLDGWTLRGEADVAGSGFTPDWITAPFYLDQTIRGSRNDLQTLLNGIA